MSNKNIIVVGGTGLIGNSVLGYLSKKKPKIFALTRNKIPNKPENVEEVFLTLIRLNQLMKSRIGIIFIYALEEN